MAWIVGKIVGFGVPGLVLLIAMGFVGGCWCSCIYRLVWRQSVVAGKPSVKKHPGIQVIDLDKAGTPMFSLGDDSPD